MEERRIPIPSAALARLRELAQAEQAARAQLAAFIEGLLAGLGVEGKVSHIDLESGQIVLKEESHDRTARD